MRIVKIPKKRGKYRVIYVPNREERETIAAVLPRIERKARQAAGEHVHGFTRGRSAVTAARQHVGHAWTLTADLRDFFDSCTAQHLRGALTKDELSVVLVDGAPRQGLPSSPAVANLAAKALDDAILRAIDKHQIIYTRYADDLTFSGDDPAALAWLRGALPQIVGRCGFRHAPEKTEVYHASAGRRMVLGIGVDADGIHPSRAAKRRLRAAKHQGNTAHAQGLEEYCRLRPPRERGDSTASEDELEQVQRLAKRYRLGSVSADNLPAKAADERLSEHVLLTGSPVAMLGMSLWTTGWTSCHALNGGSRKRGCIFWMHVRGTVLAIREHESKSESHAGIERRLMRARCLVHTMRDGTRWYDRVYGESAAATELRAALEAAGIRPVSQAPRGLDVVGHAPAKWRAWFDSLKSRTAKASAGPWSGKQVRIVGT